LPAAPRIADTAPHHQVTPLCHCSGLPGARAPPTFTLHA
jgi:hypothetical protein